ncbi:MAG: DNA-binding transcriptional regulator Fis [Legionellaceae bacterium]|nr:DNA-binding transcriptional regulator Fis [Legionellaceae bacterium]|tara:strand:+ start:601 stop:912 length:312 start_codon:yes stop_codon:yes gene_type:complete
MESMQTMDIKTSPEQVDHVQKQPLHESVQDAMERYFSQLGDTPATDLYDMVLAEVEVPMLKTVLREARYNQSKAAIMLGLSRGTLRKKLKMYGLDLWLKGQRD